MTEQTPWHNVLDQLWRNVDALGGYAAPSDDRGQGINDTVGNVLGMIERLGGMDPQRRQSEGPTPCPRCDGEGRVGPVHINRGDKPHQWIDEMTCDLCGGNGTIDAAKRKAIDLGRQLRAKRLEREESLTEAAKRLGLRPNELSAFETGRHGLTPWAHPFATSVCAEVGYWPERATAR